MGLLQNEVGGGAAEGANEWPTGGRFTISGCCWTTEAAAMGICMHEESGRLWCCCKEEKNGDPVDATTMAGVGGCERLKTDDDVVSTGW
jgi:hypothetical protein